MIYTIVIIIKQFYGKERHIFFNYNRGYNQRQLQKKHQMKEKGYHLVTVHTVEMPVLCGFRGMSSSYYHKPPDSTIQKPVPFLIRLFQHNLQYQFYISVVYSLLPGQAIARAR